MSYQVPFAPPPGVGILWSLPTIVEAGAEGGPGTSGTGHLGEINGSASGDLASGEVTFTSSCGLCNSAWKVQWRGFTAPALPLNASINSIYAVVEAREWDPTDVFNSSFYVAGAPNNPPSWTSPAVGQQNLGVLTASTGEPAGFTTIFTQLSIGSSSAAITGAYIVAGFFQTLSLVGDGTLQLQNPRLAVYYNVPILPIGHGANCNAYDPIAIADGSVTAPGNGLLIS